MGWDYDADLADEEALLERYLTLTGWSEALLAAGGIYARLWQRQAGGFI